MQQSSVLSLSPSFNSYSSRSLSGIATEIVESSFFKDQKPPDYDLEAHLDHISLNPPPESTETAANASDNTDDEDDFEFAFVCRDPDTSPISADEIFSNGQIRPLYPIFNRDITVKPEIETRSIRLPLGKLLREDRDPPSSSSSEADELDRIPAETYCVWRPRSAGQSAASSPDLRKKSNSTGSSKRWKFRDLLHRSSSDGKETFVFLAAPKKGEKEKMENERRNSIDLKSPVKGKSSSGEKDVSVADMYVKNRILKEGDRRRSYLPYRQDLVGFFANVNGMSKSLHPF